MVSGQFIPPILSEDRLGLQARPLGYPMSGPPTLSDMPKRIRERTPFGQRLFDARTHAKLSQAQLASAAKISQGNVGELEWIADGSSAVVRLAVACGVRASWLADGEGDMVDPEAWPFPNVQRDLIRSLDETQVAVVEGAMINALSHILKASPKDVQAFTDAHGTTRKRTTKRRTA